MFILLIVFLISSPIYSKSGNHLEISGDGEILENDIKTKTQFNKMESCTILFGVTSIGMNAFDGCSMLESLELSDSIINIKRGAFQNTKLKKLRITVNITSLVIQMTFKIASFECFEADINNKYYSVFDDVLYNKDQTILLSCPPKKKSIKFPPNVTVFGEFSFWTTGIESLQVPDSVSKINMQTFVDPGEGKIISFGIGSKLTVIPAYSFWATAFEEVIIPPSVEEIQPNSFYHAYLISFSFIGESRLLYLRSLSFQSCTKLHSVRLPKSIRIIDPTAFSACSNLSLISIEPGCESYITTEKGSIVKNDFSEIVFVPLNSTSLFIYNETKTILLTIIQKLTEVPIDGVTIDSGNEYIKYDKGLFYNNDYTEAVGVLGSIENAVIHSTTTSLISSLFFGIEKLRTVSFEPGSSQNIIIGHSCFSNCINLETAVFPDSVTQIGERSFLGSGIKNFTIPSKLNVLSNYLFQDCFRLTSVFSPKNCETKYINEVCFLNSSITSIELPPNLLKLQKGCFENSSLTEISFPISVTTIYVNAFSNSSIANIIFPDDAHIEKISSGAFNLCPITHVRLPKSLKTLESSAFSNCALLMEVEFADGCKITEIPSSTFEGCILLKTFPVIASIERIDASSFLRCFNLTEFDIKDPTNNHFVFEEGGLYDKKRESLYVFPPGLKRGSVIQVAKEVKANAFYGDSLLEELSFDDGSRVESFGKDTFFGCTSLSSLVLPALLKNIDDGCFRDCTGLENVIFRDGSQLLSVGSSTFEGCKNLTTIDFGKGSLLKEIGEAAFRGCSCLRSIKFPSKINKIGGASFYECSSLESIEFESRVDGQTLDIPNACFARCVRLSSVEIPSFIRSIGVDSFTECTSLFNLTLSEGIVSVGDRSFMGSGLVFADLPSSICEIGSQAFASNPYLKHAIIRCPRGLKLKPNCFSFCEKLTNVSFCSEESISAEGLILKGSNAFVYVLSTYPGKSIGGERVIKVMDRCMIFPSVPFTEFNNKINQFGLLVTSIIDYEED